LFLARSKAPDDAFTPANALWYGAAPIPLVVRLVVLLKSGKTRDVLAAAQHEENRALLFSMAGFSLAGLTLLAGTAIPKVAPEALLTILASFVFYLMSLAFQGWKTRNWQDQLGDGFREAGNYFLVLFTIALAFWAEKEFHLPAWQVIGFSAFALLAWLIECFGQIQSLTEYLKPIGNEE
jgi:hypothetical protein